MSNNNWRTPKHVLDFLGHSGFCFQWDLAASHNNAVCDNYFTKEQNALSMDWWLLPNDSFCNPPYSKPNLPLFMEKAYLEGLKIQRECLPKRLVFLVPLDQTDWSRSYVFNKAEIWIPDERIPFVNPDTGEAEGTPSKGNMIAIYGYGIDSGHIEIVHIPNPGKELKKRKRAA